MSIKAYLGRSFNLLKRNTAQVMRMDIMPDSPPITLLSFTSLHQPVDPVSSLATGSDADIGGLSTCNLTPIYTSPASLSPSSTESLLPPSSSSFIQPAASGSSHASASGSTASHTPGRSDSADGSSGGLSGGPLPTPQEYLAFHGNLSLKVPSDYTGRIRTGYAAFRNKTRPTIFGEDTWDLTLYSHLRVVVGYRGWEGWRTRWVLNIQTDGPVRSDLFQHRLDIPPSITSHLSPPTLDPLTSDPPQFTTLHLPLDSFVLTNSGHTAAKQISMLRTKIRTFGFALLGGGRTDDHGSAPPPLAVGDELKRLGAGGWGKNGGDVQVDKELEDLIASDELARAGSENHSRSAAASPAPKSVAGSAGGKYHRLGASSESSTEEEKVSGTAEEAEGYYELCIKSVEAVKWDPEVDDESS